MDRRPMQAEHDAGEIIRIIPAERDGRCHWFADIREIGKSVPVSELTEQQRRDPTEPDRIFIPVNAWAVTSKHEIIGLTLTIYGTLVPVNRVDPGYKFVGYVHPGK